ncbi:hypothetical protein E2562_014562, partial [Oryza meyeriana var. granulata]
MNQIPLFPTTSNKISSFPNLKRNNFSYPITIKEDINKHLALVVVAGGKEAKNRWIRKTRMDIREEDFRSSGEEAAKEEEEECGQSRFKGDPNAYRRRGRGRQRAGGVLERTSTEPAASGVVGDEAAGPAASGDEYGGPAVSGDGRGGGSGERKWRRRSRQGSGDARR